MKCPECGGQLTERIGDHHYLGDELPNVVLDGVKIRACAECDFRSVGIPKLAGLHKALAECTAKATHLLTPGEIRFLRNNTAPPTPSTIWAFPFMRFIFGE